MDEEIEKRDEELVKLITERATEKTGKQVDEELVKLIVERATKKPAFTE